jgi:hypothetical protein
MTCRVCGELLPFTSRPFCRDRIASNYRARLRLGMSPRLCGLWTLRDLQRHAAA